MWSFSLITVFIWPIYYYEYWLRFNIAIIPIFDGYLRAWSSIISARIPSRFVRSFLTDSSRASRWTTSLISCSGCWVSGQKQKQCGQSKWMKENIKEEKKPCEPIILLYKGCWKIFKMSNSHRSHKGIKLPKLTRWKDLRDLKKLKTNI